MRGRAVTLLAFAVALLLQQLPLEPMLWGEAPKCCALAKYCPMSAKPAPGARSAAACEMKRETSCSIQASCPTGRHETDGTISASAAARPAVLDETAWAPPLDTGSEVPPFVDGLVSPSGTSPPTPPPQPAFV